MVAPTTTVASLARSRLPRPSRRSRGRALGDLTRCVRLSDVGMSSLSHSYYNKVIRLAISVFIFLLLSISLFVLVIIAFAKE